MGVPEATHMRQLIFLSKWFVFTMTANAAITLCFNKENSKVQKVHSLKSRQNPSISQKLTRKTSGPTEMWKLILFSVPSHNECALGPFGIYVLFGSFTANARATCLPMRYGSNQDVDDNHNNSTNNSKYCWTVEKKRKESKKTSVRGVLCLSRAQSLL